MNTIHVLSSYTAKPSYCRPYYKSAKEGHFWIEWRFKVFLQQLHVLGISKEIPLKGLDAGCGNGVVRRQIEQHTCWIVDGADLAQEALALNISHRGETFLYDIRDCHMSLKEVYDFVVLFDVLEHIEDPRSFLESVLYHLRPRGWLFINVPALNILFSRYDRVQMHFRRYTKSMIKEQLMHNTLKIQSMRYWGFSLLPFAILRKFLSSRYTSDEEVLQKGFNPPSNWLNTCLLRIMHRETSYFKKPILGTSLMVAAIKLPSSY